MTCDEARDQAAAFVLGALTPDEERAVRDHLATCAEAHPEFAELGSIIPAFAASLEQTEPPPALRGRIMAAAAADLRERRAGMAPAAATAGDARVPGVASPAVPAREGVSARDGVSAPDAVPFPVARARSRAPRYGWALGIAAALVIAALGAWNIRLLAQLSDAQAYQGRVEQVLAIARTPGSVVAVLSSPTAAGQDGLVAVGPDGRAAMVVNGLSPTAGGEVYEVWFIVGSNAPQPVGALSQSGGVWFMSGTPGPVPAGATVALTREPGPNPTAPTSSILVKGVVGPAS
jgi:anti-sigma-K factor RskA